MLYAAGRKIPKRLLERPETKSLILSNSMIPRFKKSTRMRDAIFVWIPKCAGTSIYRSLGFTKLKRHRQFTKFNNSGRVTFDHVSLLTLLENNYVSRQYYNRAFKFCFVRNPWDRIISLYHYLWRYHKTDFKNFCYLIDKGIDDIGLYNSKGFSQANPQYKWIYDENMKCIVDFIGRHEMLQHDFDTICNKLNMPSIELLRANRSRHRKPYPDYYDDETKEIVRKIYKKDIELFGYEF